MAGLWLFFMAMIFIIEPLLHERFERQAQKGPQSAFRRLITLQVILLAFSAVTALGAVAGAQGFEFW